MLGGRVIAPYGLVVRLLSVPTSEGALRVAHHGADPATGVPVVLAAHGLAANGATWHVVARCLGADVCLLAPDLRGRGGSTAVGPPYSIRHHVADLLAVADHVGADQFVFVGSSMGCYVGATLARLHPERVHALVFVDALLPRPMPLGVDLDDALAGDPIVGGALQRIAVTAESVAAYRDLWRTHPAFMGTGIEEAAVVAYSDGDMAPGGPPYQSATRPDAIVGDARSLRLDDVVSDAANHVRCPVWLLRATRGLRNEPSPFVSAEEARAYAERHRDREVHVVEVPDTNHFSIALSAHGAATVASVLRDALDRHDVGA